MDADTQSSRPSQAAIVCAVAVAASAILGAAVALLPLGDVGMLALVVAVGLVTVVASAGRPRPLLVIGAIGYVVALQWVYVDWVEPLYAYSGLVNSGVAWPSLVVVSMIAAAPASWLPIELERPSDALLWPLYLFGYVPAATIPIYLLGPDLSAVLLFELVLAVAFGTLGLMQRVPRMTPSWQEIGDRWLGRLLVTLGMVAIPYLVVVFAPTGPPDIASVYGTRAHFSETQAANPGSAYILPWLGNVIYPLLVALGLSRSRPFLLSLGVVGQMLIYTISGLKTVLFSVLFLPLLFAAIRLRRRSFGTLAIWGGVSVLASSSAPPS